MQLHDHFVHQRVKVDEQICIQVPTVNIDHVDIHDKLQVVTIANPLLLTIDLPKKFRQFNN